MNVHIAWDTFIIAVLGGFTAIVPVLTGFATIMIKQMEKRFTKQAVITRDQITTSIDNRAKEIIESGVTTSGNDTAQH